MREKFERVEQVMEVVSLCTDTTIIIMFHILCMQTGLHALAETVVGGTTGPGLSGGQKKRLVVALQVINLPSVIFLDEPTSGNGGQFLFESMYMSIHSLCQVLMLLVLQSCLHI